jgi:hypothetical protein
MPMSSSPTTAGSGEIEALGEPLQGVSADDFAVRLLAEDRDAVEDVIDDLVAKRVRRRIARAEFLDRLADTFPSFVTALDADR